MGKVYLFIFEFIIIIFNGKISSHYNSYSFIVKMNK